MNTDHILERLFSMHRFGIKPGLERTLHLLDKVDNPHLGVSFIHVAGTNGKGSVCSTIASVLMEQGMNVGLYTSPHIHRFHERIRFNGVCISDHELCSLFEELEPFIAETEATFFEVTTAMAFLAFRRHKVDVAVLETGMGGRFDATNVVTPLVSVITSIDLDHQEYLGSTLEEICYQKAGIIKHGVPVVVGEQREHLRAIIAAEAQLHNAPVIIARDYCHISSGAIDDRLHQERRVQIMGIRRSEPLSELVIDSPLSGEHQATNLACVIAAIEACAPVISVSDEAIIRGCRNVVANSGIAARLSCVKRAPVILADVGHNEACLLRCRQTLEQSPYSNTRFAVVFGVMKDKDCAAMLREIAPLCHTLYAGAPSVERAMISEEVVRIARECGVYADDCGTIPEAAYRAVASGMPVLILGSFYVVDEALRAIPADAEAQW